MSDLEREQPRLHNVSPGSLHTVLGRIELTDPQPFAEALVALGVPETDVAEWHIYSSGSREELPPKSLVLDPELIDVGMDTVAGYGDEGGRNYRFVSSFHNIAPRVILNLLAEQLAIREMDRKRFFRVGRRIANRAGVVAGLLTELGLIASNPKAGIEVVPEALLSGYLARTILRVATSPDRRVKKMLTRVNQEKPEVISRLAEAVRPEYYPQ